MTSPAATSRTRRVAAALALLVAFAGAGPVLASCVGAVACPMSAAAPPAPAPMPCHGMMATTGHAAPGAAVKSHGAAARAAPADCCDLDAPAVPSRAPAAPASIEAPVAVTVAPSLATSAALAAPAAGARAPGDEPAARPGGRLLLALHQTFLI